MAPSDLPRVEPHRICGWRRICGRLSCCENLSLWQQLVRNESGKRALVRPTSPMSFVHTFRCKERIRTIISQTRRRPITKPTRTMFEKIILNPSKVHRNYRSHVAATTMKVLFASMHKRPCKIIYASFSSKTHGPGRGNFINSARVCRAP